jgi:hypothetical protein
MKTENRFWKRLQRFHMSNKGYSIAMMIEAGISFVVLTLVLTIGAVLEVGFNTSANNSQAYQIIANGLSALNTFASWEGILALAIVGTIIIMLIVRAFGGLASRGGE